MERTLRVLIVEDNKIVQKAYTIAMEDLGYYVETADTGTQALMVLKANQYDLVLMDMELPDKSGLDVTRIFRQCCEVDSNTSIIAITEHLNPDIKNACFDAGCDLVLRKFTSLKELKEKITTFVSTAIKRTIL